MKKALRYNVIFKPEQAGGFTGIVPSLPGCITYGKNLKEAKEIVVDAIEGYIASLKKHKEAIPTDEDHFFTSVEIKKSTLVCA